MKQLFAGECRIIWLIGIAAVVLAMLAAGCSPVTRLNRLAAAHPDATASICARMYPVRESSNVRIETVIDTQYQAGPVVYVDCDSAKVRREPGDTSRLIIAIPCPPAQLIRTLVTKDSIVRVENTAALTEARNEAKVAQLSAAALTKSRQIWRWAAIGLAAFYILTRIVRKFFKVPFL